jgi:hypothetical protein
MTLVLGLVLCSALGYTSVLLLRSRRERSLPIEPAVVEGLTVPPGFIRAVGQDMFIVPSCLNAYGNYWEPRVLHFELTSEVLTYRRAWFEENFASEQQWFTRFAAAADAWAVDPDFLLYPTDFSRLLRVGVGGGNPIYLDFREDDQTPRVIWWNGLYWRKLAPDIDAFLALLKPHPGRYPRRWQRPPWVDPGAIGVLTVALAAVASYDIWEPIGTLVELVFSSAKEPTVVFLPLGLAPNGRTIGRSDWQIQVKVDQRAPVNRSSLEAAPTIVTIRGTPPTVEAGSPRALLGRAALTASQHFGGRARRAGIARASEGVPDARKSGLLHPGEGPRSNRGVSGCPGIGRSDSSGSDVATNGFRQPWSVLHLLALMEGGAALFRGSAGPACRPIRRRKPSARSNL